MNQAMQPAPQGQQLSPQAQQMLNEVELLPGEQIHYSIQGDGFFLGANPLAKAVAAMQSAIATMTGGHIRIFVIVTSLRILMLQSHQMWCGCRRVKSIDTITLAALAEAGSVKETQWCCFHTRAIHLESKTQRYGLVIKKLDDRAMRGFVQAMSAVMVANVQNRTTT